MNQTPYVIGSYVVTLGGIALYTWRLSPSPTPIQPAPAITRSTPKKMPRT